MWAAAGAVAVGVGLVDEAAVTALEAAGWAAETWAMVAAARVAEVATAAAVAGRVVGAATAVARVVCTPHTRRSVAGHSADGSNPDRNGLLLAVAAPAEVAPAEAEEEEALAVHTTSSGCRRIGGNEPWRREHCTSARTPAMRCRARQRASRTLTAAPRRRCRRLPSCCSPATCRAKLGDAPAAQTTTMVRVLYSDEYS